MVLKSTYWNRWEVGMKYKVYINENWSPYVNTWGFKSIGEFDTEELAKQAIALELDNRYPNNWTIDADQYVHKQSSAGNLKLARIEPIRTDVEQIEFEIQQLVADIESKQKELSRKRQQFFAAMGYSELLPKDYLVYSQRELLRRLRNGALITRTIYEDDFADQNGVKISDSVVGLLKRKYVQVVDVAHTDIQQLMITEEGLQALSRAE
jgi:hypothetical protein